MGKGKYYPKYDPPEEMDPTSSGQVVPEPLTIAGVLMGAGVLAGYIRKRRTSRFGPID